jgi:hypothetical protein
MMTIDEKVYIEPYGKPDGNMSTKTIKATPYTHGAKIPAYHYY